MAKKLNFPEIVGDKLKEIGEKPETALWDCHGTLCIYHKALERVAASQGVTFDDPQLISVDLEAGSTGYAAVWVKGTLRKKSEWSYGEASSKNSKNKFPLAMAEKRAKDRVILKLIGLHGYIYSDDELEDTEAKPIEKKKDPATQDTPEKTVAANPAIPSNQNKPLPDDKMKSLMQKLENGKGSLKDANDYMRDQKFAPTDKQLQSLIKAENIYKQEVLNEID